MQRLTCPNIGKGTDMLHFKGAQQKSEAVCTNSLINMLSAVAKTWVKQCNVDMCI